MAKTILMVIVPLLLMMCACVGEEPSVKGNDETVFSFNRTCGLTRSQSEIPPFYTGEISFENGDTIFSENKGYRAMNISFSSELVILARKKVSDVLYGCPVEVWQNMLVVENKSTGNQRRMMVSLIPDSEYYEDHKFIDWSNFKHLGEKTGFSGFEVRTDWDSGKILTVICYYNGQALYRVSPEDEVKTNFILAVFKDIVLQKISPMDINDIYHETSEQIFTGIDDEGNDTSFITVKYGWVEQTELVDDQDHGDLPEDGSGGTGSGHGSSGGGINQNDKYSLTGNETLFSSKIIISFPYTDFESTPCTVMSMALMYNNIVKTPLVILNEVKSANNNEILSIYPNSFSRKDLLKIISLNFVYNDCIDIKTCIRKGYPVFSVYNPTGSPNYVSAVLIVGYTEDGQVIFYDPESDCLKVKNSGIFDMDMTFELVGAI